MLRHLDIQRPFKSGHLEQVLPEAFSPVPVVFYRDSVFLPEIKLGGLEPHQEGRSPEPAGNASRARSKERRELKSVLIPELDSDQAK